MPRRHSRTPGQYAHYGILHSNVAYDFATVDHIERRLHPHLTHNTTVRIITSRAGAPNTLTHLSVEYNVDETNLELVHDSIPTTRPDNTDARTSHIYCRTQTCWQWTCPRLLPAIRNEQIRWETATRSAIRRHTRLANLAAVSTAVDTVLPAADPSASQQSAPRLRRRRSVRIASIVATATAIATGESYIANEAAMVDTQSDATADVQDENTAHFLEARYPRLFYAPEISSVTDFAAVDAISINDKPDEHEYLIFIIKTYMFSC